MRISILSSNLDHPVIPYLKKWIEKNSKNHDILLVTDIDDLKSGDFLFLISFLKKVPQEVRNLFTYSLVIHGSDLPKGRGWSPLVWQVLEGNSDIVLTLFEAVDEIDSGKIWKKEKIHFEGHELFDEINEIFFNAEMKLMDFALESYLDIIPYEQTSSDSIYYKRRNPIDSQIDQNISIAEQFDLLRISDPKRYPAFFIFRNHKYKIFLEKID
jgi:methionyl-tRNA formyltransferase